MSEFVDSLDNLLDVATKIVTNTSRNNIDPISAGLKSYFNIWKKTKDHPVSHIQFFKPIALSLVEFVKEKKGTTEEVLITLYDHIQSPGKVSYKVNPSPLKEKSKSVFYISSIMKKAIMLSEEKKDDDESQEKLYSDIYMINLLKCCNFTLENDVFTVFINLIEENLGIEKGATAKADPSVMTSLSEYASDITGKNVKTSDIELGLSRMLKDDKVKHLLKSTMGGINKTQPGNLGEVVKNIFSAMKDIPMDDNLRKSIEATADSQSVSEVLKKAEESSLDTSK